MSDLRGRFHVQRRGDAGPDVGPGSMALADQAKGVEVTALVGSHVGSAHTGWAMWTLAPSGQIDTHVHSFEQSFFVLAGNPLLRVDGRSHCLAPNECGLLPVGVPHAWTNDGRRPTLSGSR